MAALTACGEQVLQPIENPVEMHQSRRPISSRNLLPWIITPSSFAEAAFRDSREITAEKIALALENYLLTLTSFDAKFDRVLRGEEKFTAEGTTRV